MRRLLAEARFQQPGDLPEGLKGQPRLGEVEDERAPQDRGEARGQNAGDSFVRVDIQDQLEDPGALLGPVRTRQVTSSARTSSARRQATGRLAS